VFEGVRLRVVDQGLERLESWMDLVEGDEKPCRPVFKGLKSRERDDAGT
jgi:hypothetical protein